MRAWEIVILFSDSCFANSDCDSSQVCGTDQQCREPCGTNNEGEKRKDCCNGPAGDSEGYCKVGEGDCDRDRDV